MQPPLPPPPSLPPPPPPPPPEDSVIVSIDSDDDNSELLFIRTYHIWQGDNIFLFGGRLIFGPKVRFIFVSIFVIVAPVAVFCAMIARKLLDDFPHHLGWSIMATPIALTLFVVMTLVVTSGIDPGIVPRNAHPPKPDDYSNDGQSSLYRLPRTKDVIVNGETVQVKYCQTCMLYRPPRASHCSVCDNCVERFDHHCPWLGQCIGLRNYRFYLMFVFSATLLGLYIHAFCWVYIMKIKNSEEISIWKAMSKTIASIALIIYSFPVVGFVGALTVFHTYLISKIQSTYEHTKYRCKAKDNPYHRGIFNNLKEIFCTKIPPSKNNFRDYIPVVPLDSYQRTGVEPLRRRMERTPGNMGLGLSSVYSEPNEGSDYRESFGNEARGKHPLLDTLTEEPMKQMNCYNEPKEEESDYRERLENEARSKESSLGRHPLGNNSRRTNEPNEELQ